MGTKLTRPAAHKVERVASVAWMVGLGRGVRPKWPTLTSRGLERVTAAALAWILWPGRLDRYLCLSWVVLALEGRPGRRSIWTRPQRSGIQEYVFNVLVEW